MGLVSKIDKVVIDKVVIARLRRAILANIFFISHICYHSTRLRIREKSCKI